MHKVFLLFCVICLFDLQSAFSQLPGSVLIEKLPEAGPWTLSKTDINGVSFFVKLLVIHRNAVSQYVWENLSPATQDSLKTYDENAPRDSRSLPWQGPLLDRLLPELNKLIESESLYSPSRFPKDSLKEDTQQLLALQPKGAAVARLNRMLLEDSYGMIKKRVRVEVDHNAARFAVVDYKNRLVTFYRNDGKKISSVDAEAQFKESPLGKYAGTYLKPESGIGLSFGPSEVRLQLGKVFGVVDVENGKWEIQGAN